MWAKSLVWAQARDSESAFKLIPKNLLSGRCPWDSARLRGALVEKDETCPDGDKGRYTGDSESEQVPLQEAVRWRRPGDPEALAGLPGFLPHPSSRLRLSLHPYLFSACLLHEPSRKHVSIS